LVFIIIIGLIGFILGFLISKKREKEIESKPQINVDYFNNFSRCLFLILGIVISWLVSGVDQSIFDTMKDITVNLLGFTGLIFTFVLGNILKSKSDLEKSIMDLEVNQAIQIRHIGRNLNIYDEKRDEMKNSLSDVNRAIHESFLRGLTSISMYILSIIGLISRPIVKPKWSANLLIFCGLLLGVNFLLELFSQMEPLIPKTVKGNGGKARSADPTT